MRALKSPLSRSAFSKLLQTAPLPLSVYSSINLTTNLRFTLHMFDRLQKLFAADMPSLDPARDEHHGLFPQRRGGVLERSETHSQLSRAKTACAARDTWISGEMNKFASQCEALIHSISAEHNAELGRGLWVLSKTSDDLGGNVNPAQASARQLARESLQRDESGSLDVIRRNDHLLHRGDVVKVASRAATWNAVAIELQGAAAQAELCLVQGVEIRQGLPGATMASRLVREIREGTGGYDFAMDQSIDSMSALGDHQVGDNVQSMLQVPIERWTADSLSCLESYCKARRRKLTEAGSQVIGYQDLRPSDPPTTALLPKVAEAKSRFTAAHHNHQVLSSLVLSVDDPARGEGEKDDGDAEHSFSVATQLEADMLAQVLRGLQWISELTTRSADV